MVKKRITITMDVEMPKGEQAHVKVQEELDQFINGDLRELLWDNQGVSLDVTLSTLEIEES